MAKINIVLGGNDKKKKPQVDNTLNPISQTAKTRIETDKIRAGTSTMQGARGFSQGYNGYKAQMPTSGYDRINPIINDITEKTKQYRMPKFDKSKSVLSNDWFDTALKRIQVRNQMKMDIKRRDTLNSLLTSLIRSRDNVYDTTARVGARMRGQDMRYDLGQDQLNEQKRYHDILNAYYGNQINAQLRGQDIKENIAMMRTLQGAEDQDDLMAQIKRMKSVKPDNFKTLLPDDVAENIDADGIEKAYKYFVQTGKLPQFKKVPGTLWGYNYEPVFGESPTQQQRAVEANDNQATKPIGFDPYLKKNLINKKVIDGKEYYKTEDGAWITY